MAVTDEQRARLRQVKLAALARDRQEHGAVDGVTSDATPLPVGADGAALLRAGTVEVLTEDPGPAALAAALLVAARSGAARLVLYVDDLAGDLARWAAPFSFDVEVREVRGATSVPAEPTPVPGEPEPADDPDLRRLITGAGADVVVEHGVVTGEVLGLEVARLVVWPAEVGGDDAVHLEAGVGRFDRDAAAAMHGEEAPTEALARAVGVVRAHRYDGAPTHPLSLLARDRWLRSAVLAAPASVGAAVLEPVSTTAVRNSVREAAPAAAVGTDAAGNPMLVVCAVGASLSLVPVAADTRAARAPHARLVLAVPARDHLPALDTLAGLLREPAEVLEVPVPWGAT
ncbi:MAG: hypothetical protein ACOYOP_00780 [Microthrixaceae bacterium]